MMEAVRLSSARCRSAGDADIADDGYLRAAQVERDKYKELCEVLTTQLESKVSYHQNEYF